MSTPSHVARAGVNVDVYAPRATSQGQGVSREVVTAATRVTIAATPTELPEKIRKAAETSPALCLLIEEVLETGKRGQRKKTRGTLGHLTSEEAAHVEALLSWHAQREKYLHTKRLAEGFQGVWQALPGGGGRAMSELFVRDEEG